VWRTLLAVGFAVLFSMMLMPCHEWGFWLGCGRQPFWIALHPPHFVLQEQQWRLLLCEFALQTIFLAVLFAVVVNLWRSRKKAKKEKS
jgi:heme/copper-type cytochrome/quinol oxidase subunit 2